MSIRHVSVAVLLFAVLSSVSLATEPTAVAAAKGPYRIVADESVLRVMVYKGGLLSGLGHNHVVAHHSIEGSIEFRQGSPKADVALSMAVAAFVIDDPADRATAGEDFDGEMSDKAIAGTRKNMLGRKLLDATRFAVIDVSTVAETPASDAVSEQTIAANVVVKGREFELQVPIQAWWDGDILVVSGELELAHSDIGLRPFKAALGSLRVADRMRLAFAIRAAAEKSAPE